MEDMETKNTAENTGIPEVAYTVENHDNPREVFTEKKKRRSGAGCFLITVFVLLLILFAAAVTIIIIKEYKENKPLPAPSGSGDTVYTTPAPDATYFPGNTYHAYTPAPTERVMAQYDGQAPVITDTVNPFPEVIQNVQGGVLSVYNYGMTQSLFGKSQEGLIGSGTAFCISSEGYCVTNAHVVEGATKVTLVLSDDREIPCEVIGSDVTTDIAVLHFDNTTLGIKPLYLGDSSKVRVGEFVITVGDPSGRELAGTITFGIVSAVDREVNIEGRKNSYIQTDAAINPGNSGGPLINSKGEVIGVTSAKTVTASYDEFGNAINAEGLGFAIPINTAKTIVESLITKGRIVRPGVGVTIRPATDEELHERQLSYGLYVNSVIKNGPCDAAGITEGDVIISCNGAELHENDDFVKKVQGSKVGDVLTLFIWHDGAMKTVTVTVGDLNNMG